MSGFQDLAKDLRKYGTQVDTARFKAAKKTAKDAVRVAQYYSSGRVTTLQLRREDHPYATRHGSPRRDPEIINSQTGLFKSSWKTRELFRDGEVIFVVYNDAPYAKFLQQGTKTMFERPIGRLVAEWSERAFAVNFERELARLQVGNG